MSAARTYQCLSCRLKGAVKDVSKHERRAFHVSSTNHARKRRSVNVSAEDMGLIEPRNAAVEELRQLKARDAKLDSVRPYTEREKQLLALKYTPQQMAAIEAGEKAVDAADLFRGRPRQPKSRIHYLDDFSRIRPVVDKPVREAEANIDPDIRPTTEDEMLEALVRMQDRIAQVIQDTDEAIEMGRPAKTGNVDLDAALNEKGLSKAVRKEIFAEVDETDLPIYEEALTDPSNFGVSPKGKIANQPTSLAPAIPKHKTPGVSYPDEDEDPHLARLSLQTGLNRDDIRRLRVKNLVFHRVVNQTRLGKIQSYYFLSIAGNQNGMVGVGEGKATEEEDGRRQAMMSAIRNMRPIPRYEERTIFGDIEGKVGASVVKLSARPPGFGNRCQHLIFELARAAGIQDLAARTPRSRNKMNVVKAAWKALLSQSLPEDVARARGRKLVDVRKVYYGGQVL